MTTYTATYSPDDGKLRLYASSRLDAETFARVKAAGFKWAPKQELFVAPAWSPSREDLLIELAGEIGDDDSSLVDRAEERADRFADYSERRMADAENARAAVAKIADGIPMGQPILVAHHSEKHARRDAARIDSGMRRAVKMWETSGYWKSRAAGAIRHAKYKELPAVRHRRIKTIEADKRKEERNKSDAETRLKLWTNLEKIPAESRHAVALELANRVDQGGVRLVGGEVCWSAWGALTDGKISADEVRAQRLEGLPKVMAYCDRWIAHYDNRLEYERAMLADQLGLDPSKAAEGMAGRFDLKPGGKIQTTRGRGEWLTIVRVNKTGGTVSSVTTTAPAAVTWSKTWKAGVEEIKDYQPPTEEQAARVKAATKLPPICNYPGEGFREMTEAEWSARGKWSDFPYIGDIAATSTAGRHRRRQMPEPGKMWSKQPVYITDAKRIDPPKPAPAPVEEPQEAPAMDAEPETVESQEAAPAASVAAESTAATPAEEQRRDGLPIAVYGPDQAWEYPAGLVATEEVPPVMVAESYTAPPKPANDAFAAMRETLRGGGVKVTVAAQLFPTPRALAGHMIEELQLRPGDRVLEPSAGTGRLLDAALTSDWPGGELVAVESNPSLAQALLSKYAGGVKVRHADFLECGGELGEFDRVVMNPPFAPGQEDIRHVLHAAKFLKPGGRLVAIMSAGVTFRNNRPAEAFREYVESRGGTIKELPADSFKESGTSVSAVLVVFGSA